MSLKRIIYNDVVGDLKRKEIGIIIGPCQVGKTTLLKELASHHRKAKDLYRYFNLEMPSDAHYFGRDFKDVLTDIEKGKGVVLIDEFHYLPNATKLFKAIYDGLPGVKVYATGSSAVEMHRHLKESLAGRRRLYRLFPLSFLEWLPSKSKIIKLPRDIRSRISSQAHRVFKKYLEEFIIFGGMPGLVHEKNIEAKKRLLLDYVVTYVQKDIKALLREEDILSFNRLLSLLAAQEGGFLSENSTSQALNYSLRQVRKDLAILNQMFLLDILKPFFTNRGRELKQTNKIYYFDSGIRNAILRDFRSLNQRQDKGVLVESFVLHEIQKNLRVSQEIYYWRTREKDEVDFVLVQDRIPIPIEVKSKLQVPEIPEGVKKFIHKYPECKKVVILNDDLQETIIYQGKKVIFVPNYYAYLLPLLFE
ncbi:MAG: ATP-binding protein [Candidatus Omnitrophica bacterium]|nr:ATP-binding protein [Candidatus Omnitrophota bacterium]